MGNDLTGFVVRDPCGCVATSQDEFGLVWVIELCQEDSPDYRAAVLAAVDVVT